MELNTAMLTSDDDSLMTCRETKLSVEEGELSSGPFFFLLKFNIYQINIGQISQSE